MEDQNDVETYRVCRDSVMQGHNQKTLVWGFKVPHIVFNIYRIYDDNIW